MDEMIAYCGLTCSGCPAYIAARDDDDELRKKTAEEWTKQFKSEIKPEDINCDGCLAAEGRHIAYCGMCEIRKCGMERAVENCAHCADYACDKLSKFLDQVPAARTKLDGLRENLA
jgi:hypothetical protein